MDRLLFFVLQRLIRKGSLRVRGAGGSKQTFGDGTGVPVAVRFTTTSAEWSVLQDPQLKLGEAYVTGDLIVEQGSIADLLELVLSQPEIHNPPYWMLLRNAVRYLGRRLNQCNWKARSRRNVAHHYDLDDRLYQLFLDADRQYSCAYFESGDQSLDDAQLAKKRRLAAKLCLEPGHHVLEIGCGWGGLSLYLAQMYGTSVTAITLSERQLAQARARAAEQSLSERIRFRLQDYRDVSETFDRIVSVGMFEHVGVGFYDRFFRKCASLLNENGIMLLSSIGRSDGPSATNPWIEKYIFPGGYIPALSEVIPSVERAGLFLAGVEIWRTHYALTLQAWRDRFLAHRETVERLYDARFLRMWEFYLAVSEMAFREQGMMVFQLQLTKRQDSLPMTGEYIGQETQRLRTRESRQRQSLRLAGE